MFKQVRQGRLKNEAKGRLLDLVVCGLFSLAGCYVTYASIVDYNALSGGQVGPGVLPLAIGLTFILTSALAALRLRRPGILIDPDEIPNATQVGRVVALLTLTVAAVLLMPIIGTLVALGLFALVEVAWLERRGLKLGILTALMLPLALYLLFEAVLGVPLPAGRLGLL
jgi:hypothetical protein